ncbi:MAG: SDR family oxidoreductase [Planctomycetaceae bacterium]|jgi:3-oxoacyl-[acyl-carrier protein] reductase|nr:SDR family oxidoreductase [Planctomycetaceae bacterium]
MLLKGKNAIVTGCNRGIGRAIVKVFAENGANVWAHARKPDDGFEEFTTELAREQNVVIKPIYFDFASADQIKGGVKTIMSEKIPIDVLVNNAGVVPANSLFAMTPMEQIKDIFEINFFAQLLLTQLVSRTMSRQKSGRIVFVSSVSGLDGYDQVEYSSSKSAIICATKKLANELGASGIAVNAIAPGMTNTDMIKRVKSEVLDDFVRRTAFKRLAEPREVANAVLFLASDLASFITGQVLRVDGGLM